MKFKTQIKGNKRKVEIFRNGVRVSQTGWVTGSIPWNQEDGDKLAAAVDRALKKIKK